MEWKNLCPKLVCKKDAFRVKGVFYFWNSARECQNDVGRVEKRCNGVQNHGRRIDERFGGTEEASTSLEEKCTEKKIQIIPVEKYRTVRMILDVDKKKRMMRIFTMLNSFCFFFWELLRI